MYNVTLIAALDFAGAIGRERGLPWKLRDDMDHFKKTTMGHIVVMGRTTYDSLSERYKPLPGRENWVLSRDPNFAAPGCRIIRHPEQVLEAAARRELFVMGGGIIYALFMPYATRLLLTHVETQIAGPDAYFPEVPKEWLQLRLAGFSASERNQFSFTIVEYRKPDHADNPRRTEDGTSLSPVR